MKKTLCLLTALVLAACAQTTPTALPSEAPIPAADTAAPAQPHIGDPLPAGDGLTVTAIEYETAAEIMYLTQSGGAATQPSAGKKFHLVAVELELASGSRTMTLSLDDIVLITESGEETTASTLTLGPDPGTAPSDLAFFKGVGEDGRNLDFGLGFTGMDMTATYSYGPEGVSLGKYHGDNPVRLTFLFEVTASASVKAFRFGDLPEVLLAQ